jgi:hypothetical protein
MHTQPFLYGLIELLGIGKNHRAYCAQHAVDPVPRILLQESALAGYQHHRAAAIWPFLQVGAALRLQREPANPHDPCAIAVWFKNEHLGYIPRRENRTLAQLMDRGERLEARIVRLLEEENPWRRIRFRVDLRANRF